MKLSRACLGFEDLLCEWRAARRGRHFSQTDRAVASDQFHLSLFLFFFFHFHTDCELFLVGEITTQEAAVNQILGGTQTLHLSYFECFRLSFVHKTGKKNYRNLSSMSVRPNYPASMSVSLPLTSHLFFVTIWGILCQKKKKATHLQLRSPEMKWW